MVGRSGGREGKKSKKDQGLKRRGKPEAEERKGNESWRGLMKKIDRQEVNARIRRRDTKERQKMGEEKG